MTAAPRRRSLSVRAKLTLSYAGFLVAAGGALVAVAVLLLRFIPAGDIRVRLPDGRETWVPDRDDLLAALVPNALLVLAVLAVVGLVGGWFLAGRMLRPLDRISDAVRLAATGSLAHRIELPGPSDELRELADRVDEMLAQLERHVEEQRRFAANASHELRTPLAVTRTMLDVAQADPDSVDVARLLDRLQHTNARAVELTEALLTLATAARTPVAPEPIDLAVIAEEELELALARTGRDDVRTTLRLGPAPTRGAPALVARVAGNLIHNALVHNLAVGGVLEIETGRARGGAELRVESSGERLDPAVVPSLVEPFRRGAGRVRSATHPSGAGLGLALADAVARAHGGSLTLHARGEGGLVARLHLPG